MSDELTIRLFAAADAEAIDTAQWHALSADAVSPNPFYAAWNLRPALRHLGEGLHIELLTAWQGEQLLALVPVCYRYQCCGLRVASVWKHSECYSTTPLLKALPVWEQMLKGLWQQRRVQMLLNSAQVGLSLSASRVSTLERLSYQRPALPAGVDYASLQQHWSGKVRRERNRLERRFFRDDTACYQNTSTDIARHLESFIALESAGWKGRAGTAIECRAPIRAYYREMAKAAAELGVIEIQSLAHDSRLAASSIRLLSGQRAFEIKTTYDESIAGLAPGVVLELQNMRTLCERADVALTDSCTSKGNALMQQLWNSHLPVYNSACFGPGPVAAVLKVAATLYFQLRTVKRWLSSRVGKGG